MKTIILILFNCSLLGISLSAQQQLQYQLQANGTFANYNATAKGTLNYTSYGAWNKTGDYKKFSGQIIIQGFAYNFNYEGYTNLAPYQGQLFLRDRTVAIEVLDDTNGMMIIYEDSTKSYSPKEYGRFNVNWQRR